jgi:hypothetical protein
VHSGRKEVKWTRDRKEEHAVIREEEVAIWGKNITAVNISEQLRLDTTYYNLVIRYCLYWPEDGQVKRPTHVAW